MTFEALLNYFDFSYEKKADGYAFVDLQKANLGNICDERYPDPIDMFGRIRDSAYFEDYLVSDDDLEQTGCNTAQEYIEKYGNDKEAYEELYYCLHPQELSDIPKAMDPDLCKEEYSYAYKKAFEEANDEILRSGCSCFADVSASTHFVELVGFYNREDMDAYIHKGDLSVPHISKVVSVESYMSYDSLDEDEDLEEDIYNI